ncbi:MAG: POTRA domain-containing protein [Acidobacteriota bacterium]
MGIRILVLLGAALLAAPFAFPQQPTGFPLESLAVKGNDEIPADRIISASGLKLGALVDRPQFNAARDRLLATGAFESVGFDYKPSAKQTGFDATFTVVEVQPLLHYRFEELPQSDAALREALRKQEPVLVDAIPPTPLVMNRYSSYLATVLGNGIKVIGSVNADTGEAMIVFRPMGDRLNVSEVNFTGNVVLPAQELWRVINMVAIGVPYSEPLFRQMLDSSIRTAYEERGRIRVAFPKIETRRSADNGGIDVLVTISEGEPYKLADVNFKGVASSQVSEVNKLGNWTKDQIVDFKAVNEGLARIRKSYREDGYLRADTKVARDINDTTRTVTLTVTVDPGARFKMGQLGIKGLDILSEPTIRKLWRLNPGDPFKESYPDAFLAMLRSGDFFDNLARTSMKADINEQTKVVDVTLTFLGEKGAAAADKEKLKP